MNPKMPKAKQKGERSSLGINLRKKITNKGTKWTKMALGGQVTELRKTDR